MEIFNIGIIEAVFILLLMLVLLGPEGMIKTARTIAVQVRKFLHSPLWSQLRQSLDEIQDVPTRLMREAGFDEINRELQDLRTPARGATQTWNPYPPGDMSIQPPIVKQPAVPQPAGAPDPAAGIQPQGRHAAPALPETRRQAYRRTRAALRKTRRRAMYPQRVVVPPADDPASRQDHP